MLNLDEYLKYSIIVFLFLSILLWIKKPKLIFDSDKKMRQFGTGKNKTIFYYPFIILIIAILTYYFFNMLYLSKKRLQEGLC